MYEPTNIEESIKYIIYNAPYGGLPKMVDGKNPKFDNLKRPFTSLRV